MNENTVLVSNPCASGRCSSGRAPIPLINITRFKPLRLGAVFLCGGFLAWVVSRLRVSNPCASGRCSSGEYMSKLYQLLDEVSNPCASGRCSSERWADEDDDAVELFQTPAPRGGVPLPIDAVRATTILNEVSNPCASGRCSSGRPGSNLGTLGGVSNPCASGRCSSGRRVVLRRRLARLVSNPCASGRCSSELRHIFSSRHSVCRFKPLRLGAVFLWASRRGPPRGGGAVSNPCASGRCSSAGVVPLATHSCRGFKPLRLGAVFLCRREG